MKSKARTALSIFLCAVMGAVSLLFAGLWIFGGMGGGGENSVRAAAGVSSVEGMTVEEDMTVRATYASTEFTVKLTFWQNVDEPYTDDRRFSKGTTRAEMLERFMVPEIPGYGVKYRITKVNGLAQSMTLYAEEGFTVQFNCEIVAEYEKGVYNVTFSYKDASGSTVTSSPVSGEYGADISSIAPTVPKQTGKVFDYWCGSDGQEVTTVRKTETLTAVYADEFFTITFLYLDANGNETRSTGRYKYGSLVYNAIPGGAVDITYPTLPELRDLALSKWQIKTAAGLEDFPGLGCQLFKDMTLQAIYDDRYYTVSYHYLAADGSNAVKSEQVIAGGTVSPSFSLPEVVGKHFTAWKLTSGGEVPGNVYSDLSVTAQYAANVYTVTFNYLAADGTAASTEKQFTHGDAFTTSGVTIPEVVGKHFVGWGMTDNTEIPQQVTGAMSLTAEYALNVYTVTFYFLDSTGAEVSRSVEAEYGTRLLDILPELPSVAGKEFTGWNVDENVVVTQNVDYVLSVDNNGVVTPSVKKVDFWENLYNGINGIAAPWNTVVWLAIIAVPVIMLFIIVYALVKRKRRR